MSSQRAVAIVAAAGRALGASARRAGYVPLIADYFGDQDTIALSRVHIRLATGLANGMSEWEVLSALDGLARSAHPTGVVCGSGFEDRPELLAKIARHWRLLGNRPEMVARMKDPVAVAKLCSDCDIPCPDIALVPPPDPARWLVKRRGGAGGIHVRQADDCAPCDGASYFQRRVEGTPVSALVLGDGRRAVVLGLSSQWSSPTAGRPFRYGGAVRPAMLAADETGRALADAAIRLAVAAPLVGLNSVDFLVDDREFRLLEVNPRPGATIDIFEPGDVSLFALHMAACDGELPVRPPTLDGATAAAIVYADHDIPSVPAFDWPDWAADRQSAGTSVCAGWPLCTVLASAPTAAQARTLIDQRIAAIVACTRAWVS